MFKKLLLFISTLLISLKLSFAADSNLLSSFDIFGNFYNLLKGNNHILDGIAVIIFFISSFQIFNNIFAKIFRGSGNAQARKGASVILSVFITGALVIYTPTGGFVSFWGGLLLFYIGVAMLFGLYFPWAKKTWIEEDNWGKSTVLISIVLLAIIFFSNTFAYKISADNNFKTINYILSFLNGLMGYLIIAICIGGFVWVKNNKKFKKILKTPTPKQAEDQSKAELKFARDKMDRINELTIDIDHEIGDLFK